MIGHASGRRDFLRGLLALAALGTGAGARRGHAAPATAGGRFGTDTVVALARERATRPYEPLPPAPRRLAELDYDRYRRIRFDKERAIWGGEPARFAVELFAPGFVYEYGVDVFVVENGEARAVDLSTGAFVTPSPEVAEALEAYGRISGFRLHYPINREDYEDEFLVFQGASYFRAVSRRQRYGLSARGLALDVAEPTGEEFPVFRSFWIERPAADANAIVVHALLDSPSCSGAYRFAVYPGPRTTLDVDVVLFPRRALEHVGLGPLTSMYLHGPADPPEAPDYRPRVHDSLGLAMHTGADEWLWRPLQNPRRLQLSAFVDRSPKGFGLSQRERRFGAFEDLEARYERRPSAWVRPRGDWGEGHVQLVEIPTAVETNDNIVAYWRPKAPVPAGAPYPFAYRLTWPDRAPVPDALARVLRTARGRALGSGLPQMVVDYAPFPEPLPEAPAVEARASAGTLRETLVVPNPETGGTRVFLTLDPEGAPLVELRLQLRHRDRPVAETWLHRWLPR
jgi:glucans biosynthesis protein